MKRNERETYLVALLMKSTETNQMFSSLIFDRFLSAVEELGSLVGQLHSCGCWCISFYTGRCDYSMCYEVRI